MVSQHFTPVVSYCHTTPSAYLTDDAWLEILTIIAKGIRAMQMIRDHPYCWVSLSLYGFVSYVNMDASNENFNKINICILKEEADTSQTFQAYDQLQAKKDKSRMHTLVDLVASHCGIINQ